MYVADSYAVALLSGAMAVIGAVVLRAAHLLNAHTERLVKVESQAMGLGHAIDRDRNAVSEMRQSLEADNARIEAKIDSLMQAMVRVGPGAK